MTNFKNRQIVQSADGSHTFYLPDLQEHFHSVNGAVQESLHVFIEQGYLRTPERVKELSVLELGFGTGLNCFLTLLFANQRPQGINYTGLEAFPLTENEYRMLNYPEIVAVEVLPRYTAIAGFVPGWQEGEAGKCLNKLFLQLHEADWDTPFSPSGGFVLEKRMQLLEDAVFPTEAFDLVYFDAFAPQVQPALWEEQMFAKIHASMKPGGLLVTYAAKGSLKRTLKACGFSLEHPAGPPGKREMTRAFKRPDA